MTAIHAVHGCCGDGAGARAHHACCGLPRRFITKEERREMLETYREQLKKELAGVAERLEGLAT